MDLIITILPVVTKDLPIFPRFSAIFYRDASSALLQLVNQLWILLEILNINKPLLDVLLMFYSLFVLFFMFVDYALVGAFWRCSSDILLSSRSRTGLTTAFNTGYGWGPIG